MMDSVTVRPIREDELPALLSLYRHLHPDDPECLISAELEQRWQRILSDPRLRHLVADIGGQVVSACVLP